MALEPFNPFQENIGDDLRHAEPFGKAQGRLCHSPWKLVQCILRQMSRHEVLLWLPVWFLSLSLFLIFIIRPLLKQGMFLDGVTYAAIAKNLSLGYGHLWEPFYSQTVFPSFYEHPPLALYFQSLFFRVFGQQVHVEQIYSFFMALLQFSVLACYWVKKEKQKVASLGLLLFLWLLIPLNHLYPSNLLEGTLTFFTTSATLILLLNPKSKKSFFAQYLVSAMAIVVAFFCNGPTAFFPLVTPCLRGLFGEGFSLKKGFVQTTYLLLMVASLFLLFFWIEPSAYVNIQHYMHEQVLASIQGSRQSEAVMIPCLHILHFYLRAYQVVLPVALGLVVVNKHYRFRGQALEGRDLTYQQIFLDKRFLLFISLSLVSSLPVGISHKQAFNYIMQSAPFFTLAMMLCCIEPAQHILGYDVNKKITFWAAAGFGVIFIFVFTQYNTFNRDKALIEDIRYVVAHLPDDQILSTSQTLYYKWYPQAYFARQSHIALTHQLGQHYYLSIKGEPVPIAYREVAWPLGYLTLSEKKPFQQSV